MSIELDLFDPNPELWRMDDKDFVAKRKREWKSILPRIKILLSNGQLNKETMPEYKRYFFRGGSYPSLHGTAYWADILLQLLMHPSPDLKNVELNQYTKVFPLDWQQGVNQYFRSVGARCSDVAEYGAMGGKEEDIILFYNKGYDFQTKHDYGHDRVLPSCFEPYMIGRWFIRAVNMELSLNAENSGYVAYSPGLALVDHFDYAMDVYPDAVFDTKIFSKKTLSDLHRRQNEDVVKESIEEMQTGLRSLLVFRSTKGFVELTEKRPVTAERITNFIERYEKRQFKDGLLKFLDESN